MQSVRSIWSVAATVLMAFSAARAEALTCEIADPVGDFLFEVPCEGLSCAPYQDIVRAGVSESGGVLSLSLTLAADVPATPTLHPGAKRIIWAWNLNTDPATSPKGFPFGPSTVAPPEFVVRVIWDGASF